MLCYITAQYSGFIPQYKDIHASLYGDSEPPVGVNSVCVVFGLLSQPRDEQETHDPEYTDVCLN